MGIKVDDLRMISVASDGKKIPMTLVGNRHVIQLENIKQIINEDLDVILDMKATAEVNQDDKGDFIVASLNVESKSNMLVGSVGLIFSPVNQESDGKEGRSYIEVSYPFSKDNREMVETFVLNKRVSIAISLEQSPESECTPNPDELRKAAIEAAQKAKETKEEK